jgi:hypothetical protein
MTSGRFPGLAMTGKAPMENSVSAAYRSGGVGGGLARNSVDLDSQNLKKSGKCFFSNCFLKIPKNILFNLKSRK